MRIEGGIPMAHENPLVVVVVGGDTRVGEGTVVPPMANLSLSMVDVLE